MICRAEAVEQTPVTLPRTGFFISKTEVPAFIPRDDMMDQLVRWALIEAEEGGQRNFGLPMKVHQRFRDGMMWGMDIEIIKEGVKVADLSVGFDDDVTVKSEWIGQDENGFPTKEGKQEEVPGKHFEIWWVHSFWPARLAARLTEPSRVCKPKGTTHSICCFWSMQLQQQQQQLASGPTRRLRLTAVWRCSVAAGSSLSCMALHHCPLCYQSTAALPFVTDGLCNFPVPASCPCNLQEDMRPPS